MAHLLELWSRRPDMLTAGVGGLGNFRRWHFAEVLPGLWQKNGGPEKKRHD